MKDQFELHAARAFFAIAWADQVEENGAAIRGEIMDQIPDDIDPAATHAARTLCIDIERVNGRTIDQLINLIKIHSKGDRPNTIEYFGHYAAMQAMGHGVGLRDAFGSYIYNIVKIPYVEFGSCSLERDYS